jgi:hypothetical protein
MVYGTGCTCNKDAQTAGANGLSSGQIVLDFGLYTKRVYTKLVPPP